MPGSGGRSASRCSSATASSRPCPSCPGTRTCTGRRSAPSSGRDRPSATARCRSLPGRRPGSPPRGADRSWARSVPWIRYSKPVDVRIQGWLRWLLQQKLANSSKTTSVPPGVTQDSGTGAPGKHPRNLAFATHWRLVAAVCKLPSNPSAPLAPPGRHANFDS